VVGLDSDTVVCIAEELLHDFVLAVLRFVLVCELDTAGILLADRE